MQHDNNEAEYLKIYTNTVQAKGKIVPTHAMKAYGASKVGGW